VFGPNVVLQRTIRATLGESRLFVEDVIVNEGFEPAPLMVLYHINGGFPIVDKGSELLAPSRSAKPYSEYAEQIADRWRSFTAPVPHVEEACYLHTVAAGRDGKVVAALVNRKLDGGFGYYLEYKRSQLPYLVEWKMMGEGMYAVGTEPCTMPLASRADLREQGKLQFLAPGEERRIELEIGVVQSARQIRDIERRCRQAVGKKR